MSRNWWRGEEGFFYSVVVGGGNIRDLGAISEWFGRWEKFWLAEGGNFCRRKLCSLISRTSDHIFGRRKGENRVMKHMGA